MVTFSHSWSLCIEEQFYLVFPLIFMLLAKRKNFVALAWLTIIVGMLFGVLNRMDAWYSYGETSINFRDYYQHIYYSSFTRFDELLPGVAIAMLKNFHPRVFNHLLQRANLIFVLGLLLLSLLFYYYPHAHVTKAAGFNFWLSTFGYSALAIGFALLTCSALSPQSPLGKLRMPGAAQLALWSYAIYLIHKPLFQLLIAPLTDLNIDVKAPAGVTIMLVLSIAAGWLLFKWVETPFMQLRSKHFPTNLAVTKPMPAAVKGC
jgi:peptidoglycan/LPS O-acetylase OafA/YrhL